MVRPATFGLFDYSAELPYGLLMLTACVMLLMTVTPLKRIGQRESVAAVQAC